MSEQVPTKDQVSLDDLKRAHARLRQSQALYEANKSLGWDIESDRAEFWRTAFEWREKFGDVWSAKNIDEHHEGLRLIRELR